MNLNELVEHLQADTWQSVLRLGPELALCVTILLMLGVRVFDFGRKIDPFFFALIGALAALYFGAPWKHIAAERVELFTGMLVYDGFTVYIRAVLVLFLALFVLFTKLSGIPDREDSADIYALVFGGTLGMCLMASANHLLIVFLAVEMASVPSYALAGLLKGRKTSSEAALKYAVYGAGAAGVMLYGISLLAGLTNTAHLPTIAIQLGHLLASPTLQSSEVMVLAFAGLLIAVGLAFKLSAVPFHFWAPDVFEGASAEVGSFLSVASKAAALTLLLRVCIGVGFGSPSFEGGVAVADHAPVAELKTYPVALQDAADPSAGTSLSTEELLKKGQELRDSAAQVVQPSATDEQSTEVKPVEAATPPASASDAKTDTLAGTRDFIAKLVSLLAIVTCTFGNLAAFGQTNIKRLLAYSTIAHAGYMMMPIPAIMALATVNPDAARAAGGAVALYIAVYVFMNLGAFAVVAFLRNAMRSEQIADYAGLIRRCPGVVICFSLMLFALVGLPPLSGFVGKFAIFASLVEGYQRTGQTYLLVLLVVGGLNTAISLYYYLRVVKVMTIDPEPEQRLPFELPIVSLPGMFILALTLPTALFMLGPDGVNEMCLAAARHLLT